VLFDPSNSVPKKLKFPRPFELLAHQLRHAQECTARLEAAEELARSGDLRTVQTLGEALLKEKFWGVQQVIAQALGGIRSDSARDALIAGLKVKNPKARRAVVMALGTFSDAKSASALRPLAEKDESWVVEGEAILAYARSRTANPSRLVDPAAHLRAVEETEAFLLGCLERESHHDVVRAGALRALAELPGVGRGERPKAMEALVSWTRRGHSEDARAAAITALGSVARGAVRSEQVRILDVFSRIADEDAFRLRLRLIGAVGEAGLVDGVPILEKIRKLDFDGRVKRSAMGMADALLASGAGGEAVAQLREQLQKLEEETRKLRAMVEEMRAGLKPGEQKK
jgi:aminopeptidase N